MSESPNPLAVTRAREVAAGCRALSRYTAHPAFVPLTVEIERAGGAVIPPLFPGGWTRIVLPDGQEISLTELLERFRWNTIVVSKCASCNAAMALPSARAHGARRGPRVDRRYCSDACRQRAYRTRKVEAA